MLRGLRAGAAVAIATLVPTLSGCGSSAAAELRIGALFPRSGQLSAAAGEEYRGIDIARALVNSDGGVAGRMIALDDQEVDTRSSAAPAVARLRADGVPAIVGTYSSELSMPASAAAASAGITYWEAGAVADRVTGRGLPWVFRVGASGANLGANSGRFALDELAPRLGRTPAQLRVSVVMENDDYGRSVAGAAIDTLRRGGAQIATTSTYDAYSPDWAPVLTQVAAAQPDVLVLASYIPDGVAFRRAMLAANLHVGALIGSTMAECGPEFGAMLGPDAIGVFASDRPTSGFNPGALSPEARATYWRFAAAWRNQTGRAPSEEGLAGFTAGWALFHDVLPAARTLDAGSIAAAARRTHMPTGSLPNGAGLNFGTDPEHLGQNLDAAAVIWQWQGVRTSVTVWPPAYATGAVRMVPLTR